MKASMFIDEYTPGMNTHLDHDAAIIALDYINYHDHLFCFLICVFMIYDMMLWCDPNDINEWLTIRVKIPTTINRPQNQAYKAGPIQM